MRHVYVGLESIGQLPRVRLFTRPAAMRRSGVPEPESSSTDAKYLVPSHSPALSCSRREKSACGLAAEAVAAAQLSPAAYEWRYLQWWNSRGCGCVSYRRTESPSSLSKSTTPSRSVVRAVTLVYLDPREGSGFCAAESRRKALPALRPGRHSPHPGSTPFCTRSSESVVCYIATTSGFN